MEKNDNFLLEPIDRPYSLILWNLRDSETGNIVGVEVQPHEHPRVQHMLLVTVPKMHKIFDEVTAAIIKK